MKWCKRSWFNTWFCFESWLALLRCWFWFKRRRAGIAHKTSLSNHNVVSPALTTTTNSCLLNQTMRSSNWFGLQAKSHRFKANAWPHRLLWGLFYEQAPAVGASPCYDQLSLFAARDGLVGGGAEFARLIGWIASQVSPVSMRMPDSTLIVRTFLCTSACCCLHSLAFLYESYKTKFRCFTRRS